MKKSILVPTLAASLLLGISGLQADLVKGEAAAKAQVAEVGKKEALKAKHDMMKFKHEAITDSKELDDSAKVKAIEAKDKVDAKTETKAFKKESQEDKQETLH